MAKVVRQGNGGGVSSIRAKELVPGDIVEVSSKREQANYIHSIHYL